jgi:hypothetical protein
VREGLQQVPGILIMGHDGQHSHTLVGSPCCSALDPLRFTVCVQPALGMSGFELSQRLEQEHGVVAELATPQVCC